MNGNTPNAERTNAVVQALHVLGRVDGKYCTTKCKECPAKQFSTEHPGGCCEYGTMKAAADLIESIPPMQQVTSKLKSALPPMDFQTFRP